MVRSGASRRPLWLISKRENDQTEVLTIGLATGRESLPVFSFEEEAETFLRLEAPEMGWRAKETVTGEIISMLYGPCTGAKKVALDPMPMIGGQTLAELISLPRKGSCRNSWANASLRISGAAYGPVPTATGAVAQRVITRMLGSKRGSPSVSSVRLTYRSGSPRSSFSTVPSEGGSSFSNPNIP
jgi:hypothetical protein